MNKYRIEKTNKFKKEYKKMKTRNNFDEKGGCIDTNFN